MTTLVARVRKAFKRLGLKPLPPRSRTWFEWGEYQEPVAADPLAALAVCEGKLELRTKLDAAAHKRWEYQIGEDVREWLNKKLGAEFVRGFVVGYDSAGCVESAAATVRPIDDNDDYRAGHVAGCETATVVAQMPAGPSKGVKFKRLHRATKCCDTSGGRLMAAHTSSADQHLAQADCSGLDQVLLLPQEEAESLFRELKEKEAASGKNQISLAEKKLLRYLVARRARARAEEAAKAEALVKPKRATRTNRAGLPALPGRLRSCRLAWE